jgi:transposase
VIFILASSKLRIWTWRAAFEPSQEAAQYYRSLCGCGVRVGLEATGNFRWFQRLLAGLGHEMLLGDPGAIHAASPRKQKTDKRDARHL